MEVPDGETVAVDDTETSELKALLISLLPPLLNPWADWPQLKLELLIHFVKAGFSIDVASGGLVEEVEAEEKLSSETRCDEMAESSIAMDCSSNDNQMATTVSTTTNKQAESSSSSSSSSAAASKTSPENQRHFAVIPTSSTEVSFALLSSPLTLVPRPIPEAEVADWLDQKRRPGLWDDDDSGGVEHVLVEFDLFGNKSGKAIKI